MVAKFANSLFVGLICFVAYLFAYRYKTEIYMSEVVQQATVPSLIAILLTFAFLIVSDRSRH